MSDKPVLDRTHHAPPGEERFGLLYSDGGIAILGDGKTLDDARHEREFVDDKDNDRSHWTKIIRMVIPDYVVVEDPAAGRAPPLSEVEALRAEVARLKAKVGEMA